MQQLLLFHTPAPLADPPEAKAPETNSTGQLTAAHVPTAPATPTGAGRRRCRTPHPRAAAHALALQHLDLADAIAGNFARRTIHPFEDLRQVAIIGLLKAAERFKPSGGRPFRPYARTYANGEIIHYLRDSGFAIKVPLSWRDLHASSRKLLRQGVPPGQLPQRLGITPERWQEIQEACSVTLVALPPET
ncbi:sigma-70 family RNA polymerase sigma factor [Cyanobium sp. ATX 6A2]|uniref:sigma-70 family RNA polymerase sigma factor n=1 Tax=Cyanobium sp. ATX 6A2 TaxID=2823700 RepID=UPI0020CC0AEB|nr:sigma factor [Cyanobium sp. ATX 6A2]